MKSTTNTITVFAVSRANIEPGRRGYILSLTDPDADSGRALDDRSFASGYAVPIAVEVPADWAVCVANDGIAYLFRADEAMQLDWYHSKGVMAAWPAMAGYNESRAHGAVTHLKAQTYEAVA